MTETLTQTAESEIRQEDVELLKKARIALRRDRRDDPAVIELSQRVRTYYQAEGLSVRKMAPRFGITGPGRSAQMTYWINKAHISLTEPVESAA